MTCQNCFNGCAQIYSDKCVRYTGVDVPILGISCGDNLAEVEARLSEALLTALNGTGIVPTIDPNVICALLEKYLPTCGNITIVDLFTSLIESACDLQEQVDAVVADVAVIEASYTIPVCVEGVISSSGTHLILQAVMTTLCTISNSVAAVALSLSSNYSSNGSELDAYIANYLATESPSSTKYNIKMIPYVAYPYFGSITGFDANGIGSGNWDKVYLCNGYNGLTPDMRGRVPVASTSMGNDPITDPLVLPGGFNPTYAATPGNWSKHGANSVSINATQMPIHTHTPNIVLNNGDPHTHYTVLNNNPSVTLSNLTPINFTASFGTGNSFNYELRGANGSPNMGVTNPGAVNVTVTSQSNSDAGGGMAHANIQPGIACYYIMYIP